MLRSVFCSLVGNFRKQCEKMREAMLSVLHIYFAANEVFAQSVFWTIMVGAEKLI